jgi:dihydrofolate reductase
MRGGVSGGSRGDVSATRPQHVAIVLLAAVADNGIIGRGGALPFRQSSDLKRFKALTMSKPVVMGRKTYLSIGKPLPGGTGVFAQTMPMADRLEITHVHLRPDGDTHFPPIDATRWRQAECSEHPAGPRDEAAFDYVTYRPA